MPKTQAVRDNIAYLCEDDESAYDVRLHDTRFPGPYYPICETPVLIVAVDSLEVRQRIWNLLQSERAQYADRGEQHPVKLLIDARSGRNIITVYSVDLDTPDPDTSIYDESFTRRPAEIPCSERAVAYNSATCAGLVGRMVAAYARDGYIPRRCTFDHGSFFYFAE